MKHQFYGSLLFLGILSACSDDRNEENDYNDKADRKICECYEERHDRRDIDYSAELKSDFEFWKARVPQFKKMDKQSVLAVVKAFRDEKVKIDKSDTVIFNSKLRFRDFRNCILSDARLNPDTKKVVEILELEVQPVVESSEFYSNQEVWRKSLVQIEKVVNEIDDSQFMNPYYVNCVERLYTDYVRFITLRFDEVDVQQSIEDETNKLRDPPPPPPKLMDVPPPAEEDVPEEETLTF